MPRCPFCVPPISLQLSAAYGEDVCVHCVICGAAGTLELQEVEPMPDGRQVGVVPVITWANTILVTRHIGDAIVSTNGEAKAPR